MTFTILDIETDGLIDDVTLIHCLSYCIINLQGDILQEGTLTDYNNIIDFIANCENIVGHNIICYDIPVLEKVLGITITCDSYDTLGLSWTLYPKNEKHGLESWGDRLGVPKPIILDWVNQSIDDYKHRCETDVVINRILFIQQLKYLLEIYDNSLDNVIRYIKYLGFKLDCMKEQGEVKCKIDVDFVNQSLQKLYTLKQEKFEALTNCMPLDLKYTNKLPPKKPHKKDGSLSATGLTWVNLLEKHNLPPTYNSAVKVLVSSEQGNPGSPIQIKNWLFSLGWIPIEFEYRANKAGVVQAIPQVYTEDGVCKSIKKLYALEPALENLDMLSLIKHRIGVLEGFLKSVDENNYVKAEMIGFTNTLRIRHKKPITNLPKVSKFYGTEIRGCIIAPDEKHVLCGSDMASLEDTTKQHYMYFFDPEYVKQMRVPGFDPHLDIGVLAQMLTEEEADYFKWYAKTKKEDKNYPFTKEQSDKYVKLNEKRGTAKQTNFVCVYGAGPAKISLVVGISLKEASLLRTTYWERNKAVKQVAKSFKVKEINGQKWLYNPVSKFWYTLRAEKDRFSTGNQSSGVYCFDLYVRFVREQGVKIQMQIHDEIAFPLLVEEQESIENKLNKAITKVNEIVKLNVPLGISMDFGRNYSEIH